MKKRIFDLQLYRDALKQGRLIGLTALIILMLEAVLIPIGGAIEEARWINDAAMNGFDYTSSASVVSALEMHPLIIATFCVATPLLVLYLFHFLTKRNACDFYHSIPQTRSCLFLSFFGAAMTWVVLYTVGPALVGAVVFAIFPKFFVVNWASVFHVLFNVLTANLLVAASIAIAVSVTGTPFTNLIVSGFILFMPRIFLTVITELVTSELPMVPYGYLMPLLDAKYNVVFGTVAALFLGSEECLTAFSSGLYTLVLGIIYMGAALVLFNRRKSEAAGQAATNRYLQLAYRMMVAMLICLIPCSFIFSMVVGNASMSISDLYLLFVFYVIAVVAYFLYELVTTRKWRNLAKAIPGVGLLFVLNVILIVFMCLTHSITLNTVPEADEIRSVNLVSETDRYAARYRDYFDARSGEVDLDDPAVKKIVSDRLAQGVTAWKQGRRYYTQEFQNCTRVVMKINTGLRPIYRYIYLSAEDMAVIAAELEQDETFRKAYMELPAIGSNATTVSMDDLDADKTKKVYEVLRQEVAAMGFAEWYHLVEQGAMYGAESLGRIQITTTIGTNTYQAAIPLSIKLPKTVKAYTEAYNESHREDKALILDFVKNWEETYYTYMDVYVNVYGAQKPGEDSVKGLYADEEMMKEYYEAVYYEGLTYSGSKGEMYENGYISWSDFVQVLLESQDKPIDPEGVFGLVTLNLEKKEEKNEWTSLSVRYYFNLDDTLKKIK